MCIVGAGYAGLNGLNAAAKDLKKGARVVVVDRNETWGGQWLHPYDFVRLHQPHRMFTAGDQRWQSGHDPSYLATRREGLAHLATVPAISGRDLEIVPRFRHGYAGHRIVEGRAEVDVVPVAGGAGEVTRIRARRLLKASGFNIERLLLNYRGDFNRWYPFYRMIPYLMNLLSSQKEILGKADRFLQTYPG